MALFRCGNSSGELNIRCEVCGQTYGQTTVGYYDHVTNQTGSAASSTTLTDFSIAPSGGSFVVTKTGTHKVFVANWSRSNTFIEREVESTYTTTDGAFYIYSI